MSPFIKNFSVLNLSQLERCKNIVLNYYSNYTSLCSSNEVHVYLDKGTIFYTFTLNTDLIYPDFETFLATFSKVENNKQTDFSFYLEAKSKNERILVEEEGGFSDSIYFTREELNNYSSFKFYKNKTNSYPSNVFFKNE